MNSQTIPAQTQHASRKSGKSGKSALKYFIISWFLLIACGVLGTMLWTQEMKRQLLEDLQNQTEARIAAMQTDYQNRLTEMKKGIDTDMNDMKSKVDAFNELLTFTKDNASTKTDNSNKLYTQLNEVKKKLDELKKNLDVLK